MNTLQLSISSFGFSTAELVNQSQVCLGASLVSSQCTVTKPNQSPKPNEQQRKNSTNRASTPSTCCSNAVEIKTPTYQEWFSLRNQSWRDGWKYRRRDGKMCPGYGKQDNWICVFKFEQILFKKGRVWGGFTWGFYEKLEQKEKKLPLRSQWN